jgi:hypothetical protein
VGSLVEGLASEALAPCWPRDTVAIAIPTVHAFEKPFFFEHVGSFAHDAFRALAFTHKNGHSLALFNKELVQQFIEDGLST